MSRHGERVGAGGTTAVTRQAPAQAAPPGSDAALASRLQNFHPGWFGAVMGTAIVGAIALMIDSWGSLGFPA